MPEHLDRNVLSGGGGEGSPRGGPQEGGPRRPPGQSCLIWVWSELDVDAALEVSPAVAAAAQFRDVNREMVAKLLNTCSQLTSGPCCKESPGTCRRRGPACILGAPRDVGMRLVPLASMLARSTNGPK